MHPHHVEFGYRDVLEPVAFFSLFAAVPVGGHSLFTFGGVRPMEMDEAGLSTVRLILGAESALDPFPDKDYARFGVRHRLAEVEKDPMPITGIHPKMVRHTGMERLPCIDLR